MLNVFIDIGAQLRLSIMKDANIILVQTYAIGEDTLDNLMQRLSGLNIDVLTFILPGFYSKKGIEGAYKAFDIKIGDTNYVCNVNKTDLCFLEKIKQVLNYKKVNFVERTGFYMTLARKDVIYFEDYGEFIQYHQFTESLLNIGYVLCNSDEDFNSFLKETYGDKRIQCSASMYSSKLMLYIKNRDLLGPIETEDLKNFLSMCLFAISNTARPYSFMVEHCDFSQVSDTVEVEEVGDTVELSEEKNKKISVNTLKKVQHTKCRTDYLKWVALAGVFLNMCFIGVSSFCQRDVIALTKQSSLLSTELNELNCKAQLLKEAEVKNVSDDTLNKIQVLLNSNLDYSIGEIVADWDGDIEILVYVKSLDDNQELELLFSKNFTDVSYVSEGTLLIEGNVWYKSRFLLK